MTPCDMIARRRKCTCYENSVSDPRWMSWRIERFVSLRSVLALNLFSRLSSSMTISRWLLLMNTTGERINPGPDSHLKTKQASGKNWTTTSHKRCQSTMRVVIWHGRMDLYEPDLDILPKPDIEPTFSFYFSFHRPWNLSDGCLLGLSLNTRRFIQIGSRWSHSVTSSVSSSSSSPSSPHESCVPGASQWWSRVMSRG